MISQVDCEISGAARIGLNAFKGPEVTHRLDPLPRKAIMILPKTCVTNRNHLHFSASCAVSEGPASAGPKVLLLNCHPEAARGAPATEHNEESNEMWLGHPVCAAKRGTLPSATSHTPGISLMTAWVADLTFRVQDCRKRLV